MSTHLKTIIFVGGALCGIVIGEVWTMSSEAAIAVVALAMVQVVVMVIGKRHGTAGPAPFVMILFAFGIFLGIIRVQLVSERQVYVCEASCTFNAKIISSPQIKDAYQVVNVRAQDLPAQAGANANMLDIQLRLPLYPKYTIGETVQVSGKVLPAATLPSHGDKKSFDYAAYLLTKDIGSEMIYPHIEVVDEQAHGIADMLGRWKENLVSRIETYVSSPASALASGMLFGASSMSKDLSQTFRTAGLSHIIVLSGFNIAIVITFILFVFAFIPLIMRIALASASVVMFVVMVGAEASVVRAMLMAFVALLATLIGRAYVAHQALILSLFTIVMYEPYSLLHDASLHLSFLATAGIVYGSAPIGEILTRHFTNLSATFRELCTTTLAAYLATLPYICFSFGTVSVYALIANIVVLPLVPVAMLFTFIVVVASYVWSPIALTFGFLDTIFVDLIIRAAQFFESLPFALFQFSVSFSTMCVAYSVIPFALMYFVKRRNETRETFEQGILTDIISY